MLPRLTRPTRLSIALIAALAAAIATLAVLATLPGSAGAECNGNKLCLDMVRSNPSSTVSAFVTSGGFVTYDVTITSAGTSTATKTKLRLDLPAGSTVPPDSAALLDNRCAPATVAGLPGITCTLGSVKPSDTPLHFTFNVKLGTVASDAAVKASLSYDARNSDTGTTGKDPTVETVVVTDLIDVAANDGVAVSAVPEDIGVDLSTDATGNGPEGANKRTAVIRVLASDFFSTAQITDEGPDNGFVCPTNLKCPGGGWTETKIPGPPGRSDWFADPSLFEITLTYDVLTVPNGLTTKGYVMFHQRNDGTIEQISRRCNKNPAPCIKDVHFEDDGDLVATALGTENIRYR